MVLARPSILTSLVWAYWDLYQVVRTLWRSVLIAFVILSAGAFATIVVPMLLSRQPFVELVVRQVFLIGLCLLLTPFFLAIHRFVLLGEAATRYELNPFKPRFQLFFGWLAVSIVLITIPSFLGALTTPTGPIYYFGGRFADPGPPMIVSAARVAVFMIVQRLLVIFPAVAVDAPSIDWKNAVRDTGHHIWFVISASILPYVPIGLLGLAATPFFRVWPGTLAGLVVSMLWLSVGLLVALMLGAVIASRLYQVVGDRLNEPPHGA